jgi:two-component system, NarL family, response regulator NreC
MNKTRIVLADDHTLMRAGLRVLLEREADLVVVGEAEDGRQTIDLMETLQPDVLVLDIAMPNLNGIEAARQIVVKHPGIAVVILSMHSDESYVLRALKAGVRGYLLKDSAESDLVRAIRAVRGGKAFFSPAVGKTLLEDYVRQLQQRNEEDSYELLTSREREILQLVAEGNSNKDVANRLNLSPYTVETHRAHILHKLGLHTVPDLIRYALRKGIVT